MHTSQYWNRGGKQEIVCSQSQTLEGWIGHSSFTFHWMKNSPLHHYDKVMSSSVKERDIRGPRWLVLYSPPASLLSPDPPSPRRRRQRQWPFWSHRRRDESRHVQPHQSPAAPRPISITLQRPGWVHYAVRIKCVSVKQLIILNSGVICVCVCVCVWNISPKYDLLIFLYSIFYILMGVSCIHCVTVSLFLPPLSLYLQVLGGADVCVHPSKILSAEMYKASTFTKRPCSVTHWRLCKNFKRVCSGYYSNTTVYIVEF